MRPPHLALALWTLIACATTRPAAPPAPAIRIAETNPPPGAMVGPETHLLVVADYSVPDVQPGRDRIVVVFESADGKTWEPTRYLLSKAQGRVTFDLAGADLLKAPSLARPLRMSLVLDRFESPERMRTLAASEPAAFQLQSRGEIVGAKFLPPSVGKGQLLSDPVHDERYRPRLPPALNRPGMVVWGLFKMCVDSKGEVIDVFIIKSADLLVDADWVTLLRTWRHRPYLINGVAVPYCYPLRLEVRASGPTYGPSREGPRPR
jgi:hypothetical protein